MRAASYDYVIVGAGSAGCVLANRLSADPGTRVLLLEAGGEARDPWLHIPVGFFRSIVNPKVTWRHTCEPEQGTGGRALPWVTGRVLGGSSAINGLVYVRGQREDYDHWRDLGCTGWGYADILPYFKRAEDQSRGADDYHGVGGPLAVSDIASPSPLCEPFIAAAEACGVPRNADFNGARQEGAGLLQLTARRGWRCSTADAYLEPVRHRANLDVEVDALALGLELEDRRVTGLTYKARDGLRTVGAREVIVSAGTMGSPRLLQLSGIGPGEVLRAAGVAVRHELPGVGRNLHDHYQVRCLYRCSRPITINDKFHSPLGKLGMALQYALTRTGELAIGAGQAALFARAMPGASRPDVQFHFAPLTADRPGADLHRFSGFTIVVNQCRPESRGELAIRSADPAAPLTIRPNYLAAEVDRATLVAGLRLARRLSTTEPLASYRESELAPGPKAETDEDLIAFARSTGVSIFHPVGTCRMGSDDLAVVDQRLKVRGLEGLRVADASIIPALVSANTNPAVIMIGERAADLIIEDGRRPSA